MPKLELLTNDTDLIERFRKLSAGRKLIVLTYFEVHREDPRSLYHVIPKIIERLGNYTIDSNGTNTHLLNVLQTFLGS